MASVTPWCLAASAVEVLLASSIIVSLTAVVYCFRDFLGDGVATNAESRSSKGRLLELAILKAMNQLNTQFLKMAS